MRDIFTGLAIGIVAGIAMGLAVYHHFLRWEPLQATTATFKPGALQADGSADLTRIPTAPQDAGPAPHIIPKGAKETARAHIVVKPKPKPPVMPGNGGAFVPGDAGPACSCEPVVIDVSQYLGPDGAGIIASSPDGEVDVSRSTYAPMLEQRPSARNFALVTHEPGSDNYSGLVGKRFLNGRLGVGAGVTKREERVVGLIGLEVSW